MIPNPSQNKPKSYLKFAHCHSVDFSIVNRFSRHVILPVKYSYPFIGNATVSLICKAFISDIHPDGPCRRQEAKHSSRVCSFQFNWWAIICRIQCHLPAQLSFLPFQHRIYQPSRLKKQGDVPCWFYASQRSQHNFQQHAQDCRLQRN